MPDDLSAGSVDPSGRPLGPIPFQAAVEAAGEAVVITGRALEPPGPTILYVNPGFTRMTGYEAAEVLGRTPRLLQGPETDQAVLDRMRAVLSAGETFRGEALNYRKDGGTYVVEWLITPIRDEAGAITHWLSLQRDMTEERETQARLREALERAQAGEDRLQRLLAELQHRVRNTIGVIRSVARRSATTSESIEDYAMHLDGRIGAFARVQAAVTLDPDAGVDLAGLVADELQAHAAREGERLRVEGPTIRLRPRAAETLGLAIHELAANAVKFGALAAGTDGLVQIGWRIEARAGVDWLRLEWKEEGLDRLVPPARRGFGTEQLERTLPDELHAEVACAFEAQGLRCTIALPLSERVVLRLG